MLCSVLASLATLASLASVANSQVLPCGGTFTNVKAALFPSDTLQVGEDAYMYLEYTAPEEITGGTTTTSVNIAGVPYPDITGNLCAAQGPYLFFPSTLEEYEAAQGVACPIEAGIHASNDSFAVPNIEGTIHSRIRWMSESGTLLLCLKIVVDVLPAVPNAAANDEEHAPIIVW